MGLCSLSVVHLRPNYGRGYGGNGHRFQRDLREHAAAARTVVVSAPDCWPTPLPETPRHSQASLSVSYGAAAPFSWVLVSTRLCLCPPKSLFPQSCGTSVVKSHWPSKSDSLGMLSPFAGSPGWGICCGPFFGIIVLQIVGCLLNGSIEALKVTSSKRLCHMLCLLGLLKPEPLSRGRPLLSPASAGDTQRQVWLSLFWGSLLLSLGPGMHKLVCAL